MSLKTQLESAFTRVATEFKTIRTLISGSGTGDVSGLNTTATDLVGAINEIGTLAGTTVAVNDLSDVVITSVADNEILQYDSGSGDWINQTFAEAGIAAAAHTHSASNITSGTFADARISQSSVKQHEAALDITESQISNLGDYAEEMTELSDVTISGPIGNDEVLAYNTSLGVWQNQTASEAGLAASSHNHAASNINSGTFADARIAETNVTQHEAALTLSGTQITSGSIAAGRLTAIINDAATNTSTTWSGDKIDTEIGAAVASLVDTAPGTLDTLNELAAALGDDPNFATSIASDIAGKADVSHNHSAADVTAGTFADARISESSVTQHEDALSITESQISDLGTYAESLDQLSNVDITTVGDNDVLAYNVITGTWVNQTASEAGLATVALTKSVSELGAAVDTTDYEAGFVAALA